MGASLELTESAPLPDRIGQYTILCQLDQGGMATLYLGRAAGLGGFERLFAIKLIHEHLSREKRFVDMFLDEARLAARIVHPNVVSVYEVGIDRGRHFIAMDYINGETLSLALQHTWGQKQPFPLDLSVYLAAQAAEGLHAAHELKGSDGQPLGVVHRDVAPSNLMIGYDGILRVMDFGVAKARDQVTHTRPGTIKGTLAYMAPEHVRSKVLDRRADVWSLGVVLWETLVGKRLFKGRNDVETSERLLRRRVLPPSQLRPEVTETLDAVVLRALDRDPNRRFATARELGDALQEHLASARVRIGPSDVEAFMRRTFEERVIWRQEIQQRAPTATAKEFRAFEGLMDSPTSDSEAEIDLLAEDAMEEIIEPTPSGEAQVPVASAPLAPSDPAPKAAVLTATMPAGGGEPGRGAAPHEPTADLISPPVVGAPNEEKLARHAESTQVIRSERALARAREGRADKVSDGRIFLYQWREKADQSTELLLRETQGAGRKWLVGGVAAAALLLVVVAVLSLRSEKEEPKFESIAPSLAEPSPGTEAPTRPPETPEPELEPVVAQPVREPVEAEPEPIAARPDPPPPAEPTLLELRFEVVPPNAQLRVDGRPHDPDDPLSVAKGRSVLVEATAAGHLPYRRSTRVERGQVLRVALSPTPVFEEAPRPKPPKKPRTEPKKKDGLLIVEGGDL